ncbi:MAG: 5-(carboxyamino)imidazole ribonucleotide synthase [Verrucomicrobia bacterium]|nr:5-(carboxyamino)imidazole ribonucleotide synthase [Cytophagales bacterium]
MTSFYDKNFKLGILGGGQLGRMLLQAAIDLNVFVKVLDNDPEAPCKYLAHEFIIGKLTDYQTVMNFGKDCEVITIEIENVNTQALKDLEKQGKKVFPQPHIIELIQDKRLQKQFYQNHHIPTADFVLIDNPDQLAANEHFLPAFQKLGREGYDGKGVQKLITASDFSKAFSNPSLLEKVIDFEKELAVIVARNTKGEITLFPVVEMVFHPTKHLVEYLLAPAQISEAITKQANAVATQVAETLGIVGLLAVEMFLTKDGRILVNEIAPRPHNSGHHTLKANFTSQFEQHLRAILGLPLGETHQKSLAAMVNLLGSEGFEGEAVYEGIKEIMALGGVFPHLYGKKVTKPFRKMGHITIMEEDLERLVQKAETVKNTLRVIAKEGLLGF